MEAKLSKESVLELEPVLDSDGEGGGAPGRSRGDGDADISTSTGVAEGRCTPEGSGVGAYEVGEFESSVHEEAVGAGSGTELDLRGLRIVFGDGGTS